MQTWKVVIVFVDKVVVEMLVAARSEKAAKRAGRNLAIGLRPYAGSPISVSLV